MASATAPSSAKRALDSSAPSSAKRALDSTVSRQQEAQFAHPSEQVFARLMDFYRIDWQYEPRTFPLEWDEQGNPRESFTPDFYLPELDLYVELTTMKQSLVRRKNRKLKRLRELYPEVNIRVFYQKDLEHLVFKLGSDFAAEMGGGPEKENFE